MYFQEFNILEKKTVQSKEWGLRSFYQIDNILMHF